MGWYWMRLRHWVRRRTSCRMGWCGGKILFEPNAGQGWQCWTCGVIKHWERFGADR